MKKQQTNALILSFLVMVIFGFLFPPSVTYGQSLLSPFGGKITTMIPCTCSSGYQINIAIPYKHAGFYLYLPGITKLYKRNLVYPTAWILGKYSSGGVCAITLPPPAVCGSLPITKGTITYIGTSF